MSRKDAFGADIPKIEKIIGYTFRDKSLLRQAFTRSSWCNEHEPGSYQSNEVLEFFGDSALSIAIISFLLTGCTERYEHGIRTELGEGDFSNIKSKLSDKTNLSASMGKLGLERYLLLGEGDAKLGIAKEPSVMEDLFESIIGAVYIDSEKDIKTVTKVVTGMLDMSVYTSSAATGVSPKNALQEWCADKKRRLPSPVYRTLSENGPDHKKVYERGVYIGDRLVASATGKNQKTADALAAKEALRILTAELETANGQAPQVRAEKAAAPKPQGNPTVAKRSTATKGNAESGGSKATKQKNTEPQKKLGINAERGEQRSEKRTAASAQPKPKAPKESAAAALKRIAAERSAVGPQFRDLGLIAKDEHSVECSFMGERSIATAPTRPEAKERAAEIILEALGKKR